MPTLPTNEELHKLREQANQAARTPLLAALGAGDFAAQTVREALTKLREQVEEQAESARAGVTDADLRGKLDPVELRKRVDTYSQSAVQIYGYLAVRGEDTLGRLQSQPQVKQAREQVEAAQDRVEGAVGDVRDLADDVLGKVTRSTRSAGEKVAEATEKASGQAAETVQNASAQASETVEKAAAQVSETVEDAGGNAATATRSTSRKAANRTAATKSGSNKSGSGKNTES